MGFCYDHHGRLVCDFCGMGPAEKYPCPFGYCSPTAACEACRKRHSEVFGEAYHKAHGCKMGHEEYGRRTARERDIIAGGGFIRCSAIATGDGDTVHVIFRGRVESIGFYMSQATYHAVPMLEPATPDDYRKHGELLQAPPDFDDHYTRRTA